MAKQLALTVPWLMLGGWGLNKRRMFMSEIWGTYLFFIILLLGGGAIFEGAYIWN